MVFEGLTKIGTRSLRVLAFTVVAAAAAGGNLHDVAGAQTKQPPPDDSAVIQYTELVPTAGGRKAPGVGKKTRGPLSPRSKKALSATSRPTASVLTEVATSSDYGAPPRRATPAPKPGRPNEPAPGERPSLDRTLQATAVAAAPVDDTRMIGLLVAMLGIAVGGGALAVRSHRV